MKNKEIKILEFGTCWPILFENISETVRDSGNPAILYRKLSAQTIQRKNTSKLDEK